MPSHRRHARILAMQALCQWDVQHETSVDLLHEFLEDQAPPQAATTYASKLVQSFWAQSKFVDRQIVAACEKWNLSRISVVERNIMRVAVVEVLDEDMPHKVVINEAIEIGREYAGGDSPRFINGVLDEIVKRACGRQKDNA